MLSSLRRFGRDEVAQQRLRMAFSRNGRGQSFRYFLKPATIPLFANCVMQCVTNTRDMVQHLKF